MAHWLEQYDYRTHISPWLFLAVSGLGLTITLLSVSFQTIKASAVGPVELLRTE